MRASGVVRAGLLLLAGALCGCASGYHQRLSDYRGLLRASRGDAALKEINHLLHVDAVGKLPDKARPDSALLLLERGALLQARGQYRASMRDFQWADERLEVLDLSGNIGTGLVKYLYSEHKTPYRAQAYEKTLLNTLNMLNYLAVEDLQGARVEARRLNAVEEYLRESREKVALSSLGDYLAGFSFEMSGRYQEAARYYADAYERGSLPGLEEVLRSLYTRTGARDPRVKAVLEKAAPSEAYRPEYAELLVLAATGSVPFKAPERVPVGLALAYLAGPPYYGHHAHYDLARRLVAEGAVKWINYPVLIPGDTVPADVSVDLDGRSLELGTAMDVSRHAEAAYQEHKGAYIAAAFLRMAGRFGLGKGVEAATRAQGADSTPAIAAGLLAEGILTLMDVPDTRSWISLPGRFSLLRKRLPPGLHRLPLRAQDASGDVRIIEREIRLRPGGFQVLYFRPEIR